MNKFFRALMIAVFMPLALMSNLSSCATFSNIEADVGFTVSKKAIATVTATTTTVDQAVTVYGNTPLCAAGQTFLKNGCHEKAALDQLVPATRAMNNATNALLNYTPAASGSLSQAYTNAQTAITAVKGILSAYGYTI